MRTPSKSECQRAMAELGAACMAPIAHQRKGAIPFLYREKHEKLNSEEDKVCHNIKVVELYIKALEHQVESATHELTEDMEEIGESHDHASGDALCTACIGKKHKCEACSHAA